MTEAERPAGSRVSDYVDVTETPGIGADQAQLQRAADRYGFAASYSDGKQVLEVACGAGLGLGLLAQSASRVVGGDLTPSLIQAALHHYASQVGLTVLDAQRLPFANRSFDVVVLFEALYYLPDFAGFLDEVHRVLRPGGSLILSTVNKEWADFNPSRFSTTYYAAQELTQLLQLHDFDPNVFVGSPVELDSPVKLVVSVIKRVAVRFNLIPRSMKAKQLLRRLFLGRLEPLPAELLPGAISPIEPTRVDPGGTPITAYKIIFVHAERGTAQ